MAKLCESLCPAYQGCAAIFDEYAGRQKHLEHGIQNLLSTHSLLLEQFSLMEVAIDFEQTAGIVIADRSVAVHKDARLGTQKEISQAAEEHRTKMAAYRVRLAEVDEEVSSRSPTLRVNQSHLSLANGALKRLVRAKENCDGPHLTSRGRAKLLWARAAGFFSADPKYGVDRYGLMKSGYARCAQHAGRAALRTARAIGS